MITVKAYAVHCRNADAVIIITYQVPGSDENHTSSVDVTVVTTVFLPLSTTLRIHPLDKNRRKNMTFEMQVRCNNVFLFCSRNCSSFISRNRTSSPNRSSLTP